MSHPWVKEERKKEIKDCLDFNENEGTTYTNLWYTMKAILREKLVALKEYIKKLEESHTSKLAELLTSLEQKKQTPHGRVDIRK